MLMGRAFSLNAKALFQGGKGNPAARVTLDSRRVKDSPGLQAKFDR